MKITDYITTVVSACVVAGTIAGMLAAHMQPVYFMLGEMV